MRRAFADSRSFARFQRLACGLLGAKGRRTITAVMSASGRSDSDWSADYRFFSRAKWETRVAFAELMKLALEFTPAAKRVVASLDDTNLRKCGTRIPGVAYRRDPMSPPFQANLVRAQRFIQASVVLPFHSGASAARSVPVAFTHAPSAGKLSKNASAEDRAAHRAREKEQSLSRYGVQEIAQLRKNLDASERRDATLLVAVDGSYTNGHVLKNLPDKTHVIGRVRKDAVLYDLPAENVRVGRPRSYGNRTLTPEQVRQDESIPWTPVNVFAAGKEHACDIKDVGPLLWRKSGSSLSLRLIIIRPLAYRRNRAGKILYRNPAYLLTTDLLSPAQELVQAYLWRWDIEVNHRDEKQLIGVGHAQVRAAQSAERAPAFAVLCYSLLLLAGAHAYGLGATEPLEDRPKWQQRCSAKKVRLSTNELLMAFQRNYRRTTPHALPNFSHFAHDVARHMKSPESAVDLAAALAYATN